MAGLFLIGTPVLGGLVGGSILQVAMRTYGLSLFQRIGVEASLMGLGSIVIYLKPMGSADTGENWGTFVLAASVVTTGGFAMAEGLIINIMPGATVLKALGLLVAVPVGLSVAVAVGEWLGRLLTEGFYVGRGTPPVRQDQKIRSDKKTHLSHPTAPPDPRQPYPTRSPTAQPHPTRSLTAQPHPTPYHTLLTPRRANPTWIRTPGAIRAPPQPLPSPERH